jgi:DNA polymerase/3'-5' exonuclease PolX
MIAIEQKHLITLVAATGICNLMELEKFVPANSRMAGQIRRMHEAITNIAAMVGGKLDAEWIDIGVNASNAGMKVIKKAVVAEGKRNKGGANA